MSKDKSVGEQFKELMDDKQEQCLIGVEVCACHGVTFIRVVDGEIRKLFTIETVGELEKFAVKLTELTKAWKAGDKQLPLNGGKK